ncbi:kinetochore-associated Ndc80 complex subunit ndc80 [Mortierella claussenii]|nr:kinetochore-associated Ndc80 complex subunit ndc80 [Mortierella claussenii]
MATHSNTMQPPSAGSGGPGSGNNRWSMSSAFRHSIGPGGALSQRPSPMAPLVGDDYSMLNSSVMGPPMNSNRRVSGFAPRQSMTGGNSGTPLSAGISGLSASAVSLRDPRPVKDRGYQRTLILNIVGFLNQYGYPHVVTTKNLSQPTNKDFQDIFKFMYLKLEPGYDFQKKFEDEVPVLLRTMRYPAADTITKTSLYTVGTPHSWPNMLALLGWMMEVILVIEKYKENVEAQQQLNNSYNRVRDLDPKMDMAQVPAEKALYYYLTRTYRVWMLTGNLQDPDLEQKMALSLQRRMDYAQEEVRNRTAANDVLKQELQALQAEESPLIALEKEQQLLRTDIEQFRKAIDHAEPRIEEVRRANEESKQKIENKHKKLIDIEQAKLEVQEVVKTQTMTRAGLDTKLEERNRLKRREDGLKQQVKDLENEQRSLDKRFQQGEAEAERLAKEYNALAVKIGMVPQSAKHANGQDYELQLDLDNAMSGAGKMFSVDIKGKAERAVSALRTKVTKDVNETSNELFGLNEELERLKDQVEEDSRELQNKEYQLGLLSKKYQEEKEITRTETQNHQTYLKSRQEQIEAMLQEMRENQAEADRLEQETLMMERQSAHYREIYNRQIKDVLAQLTETKQHVEQHVGTVLVMAERELEDTLVQKRQIQQVKQIEVQNEQRRNAVAAAAAAAAATVDGGDTMGDDVEDVVDLVADELVLERELLFSTTS